MWDKGTTKIANTQIFGEKLSKFWRCYAKKHIIAVFCIVFVE